jgi:hypothetical protein
LSRKQLDVGVFIILILAKLNGLPLRFFVRPGLCFPRSSGNITFADLDNDPGIRTTVL